GIKSGLRTVWSLGVVIFPVTFVVSVLQYTAVYDVLLSWLAPVMGLFDLPGGAAVPLVLGNLVGLYAGVGAMLAMELTVKEVFTLALMLFFSHMLPVEAAVCRRVGVSAALVISFRLVLAIVAGLAVGSFWNGGNEVARYGLVAPSESEPSGWIEISVNALQTASVGVLQLALIVIPVMIGIQTLKDLGALERFGNVMRPLMRPLGIAPRGSVTMAGGLTFGLAFGAGIIMEQAREQKFTKREITLIVLFLSACHAVVEDTLIFVPLGINVLPLLLIRLTVAILLIVVIARLWREDKKEDPA
ncbi:MAG: nucleoside recognition domain-containing protein, partial [Rubrobacteraceae bacterium]